MPYVARYFEALGDPTRRAIFEKVTRKPIAVVDLAKGLDISRPAVSQHLKILLDAGLLSQRSQGTRRIYSVNPIGIEVMRKHLDKFWDEALLSSKEIAEGDG